MQKFKILFIGLGRMGFPMAGHLSKKSNIDLYVLNRTKSKEMDWLKKFRGSSYRAYNNLKFDFIITCLKDDESLKKMLKIISQNENYKKNTILIDHSTISLDLVYLISNLFKKKLSFLDSPVTGGEEGAINGKLSVMIGGNLSSFQKSKKIISTYSKNCTYMGKLGSGQLAKFTNQILICGILYSISEALVFGKKNKINLSRLYEAIKDGAAGSWQFSNRFPTIIKNKFNFGFSTELMAKDLKYVLKQSTENKINLKLTREVYLKYKKLSNSKFKKSDTSSLIKTF